MTYTITRSCIAIAGLACTLLCAPATTAESGSLDPEPARVAFQLACDSLNAAISAAHASAETSRVDISPQGWLEATNFPTTVVQAGPIERHMPGGSRTTPRAVPGYHGRRVLIDPAIGESLVVRSALVVGVYLDLAYRHLDSSSEVTLAKPEWTRLNDLFDRTYHAADRRPYPPPTIDVPDSLERPGPIAPRVDQQRRIVRLVSGIVAQSSPRRGVGDRGAVRAKAKPVLPAGWAYDGVMQELAEHLLAEGRYFCREVRAGGGYSDDTASLPLSNLVKAAYIDCWTMRHAALESDGLWRCVLAALESDAKHGGVAGVEEGLRASLILNDTCFQRLLDGVATGCAADPFRDTGIVRENGPGDTLATLLDMTERIERNLRRRSYSEDLAPAIGEPAGAEGAGGRPALRTALDLLVSRLHDAAESSSLGACCGGAITSWIGVLEPMRLEARARGRMDERALAHQVRGVMTGMRALQKDRRRPPRQ